MSQALDVRGPASTEPAGARVVLVCEPGQEVRRPPGGGRSRFRGRRRRDLRPARSEWGRQDHDDQDDLWAPAPRRGPDRDRRPSRRPSDGRSQAGHRLRAPDLAIYPDLTARENLRFFGRLDGLGGRELAARVGEVLDVVDLSERAGDRVDAFSGGMKRRLNIAAGLLHRPSLLGLDEPTVGVDPQSRHAILDSVHTLGGSGMAVLYTTHYMEEAERICNRVGIIDRGRLVAEGTRRELIAMLGEQDRIELGASGDLDALCTALRAVPGITGASAADSAVHVLAKDAQRLLAKVLEVAEHLGVVVTNVELVEPDLEAVFLHLTGTALRD